jgi:MFS family permease
MVAFWSILIMSAGLICTAFSSNLWQFYLFFGTGRMIAVGILSMVTSVTVSNWFIRQRGRALGISWLGPRIGAIILPAFCQFVILYVGWRMSWGILGALIFLISGLPALFLLRRRPEDYGLLPDGAPPRSEANRTEGSLAKTRFKLPTEISEPVWTRTQALRTKSFWALTSIHSMVQFATGGFNFHMFPFLTDKGMDGMTSVLVLSTIAASGALGSVVFGVFAEKIRVQRLLAINAFTSGLAFWLLFLAVDFKVPHTVGVIIIFALAAVNGVTMGGRNPILDSTWATFFGRTSLGSIFSFSNPFRFAANAMGPVFGALCFDMIGSYTFPFYFFFVIFFLIGTISLLMKPPQHPLA